MKTLYTASEYANYAHVHMYAFFSYLMSELSKEHMDAPESANIAKAVSEVSAKLGKTAQIQNLELLTAEINKIAFTEARPEIPDDDSLIAPLVSFI